LRSNHRSQAAVEACALYQALVEQGWTQALSRGGSKAALPRPRSGGLPLPAADKRDAGYWGQRLIRREYAMMHLEPGVNRELSVRIDHGGIGHYFPLGTDDPRSAARLAHRIYQTIADEGWEVANRRFSRELTVAFRWLETPLAWTYTTIHTQTVVARSGPVEQCTRATATFDLAVTESDLGIRQALEWCLNHMEGFRCVATFGSAAEALRESTRQRMHLVLVSYNLADKPGTACLAELKVAAPEVCGLLYSVYEDSEELFRTTPGGAGTYLLRRTLPTQFLQPIAGQLEAGRLVAEDMASVAWQYFKDSLVSMSVGQSGRQLAHLTQREHEVLALLSKGNPDKEIADRLGISIYTVHEHVRNIFEKLGAHNRTEAAVKFLQK
jgi:DNA-binding NarL/FixJ family response regulator